MPTNKSRTLLQSVFTEDKSIEFKYYNTGSLVARYSDKPARSTGADDAFVRINNIVDPKTVALLPELFELIEAVADRRMAVVIEYNEAIYFYILSSVLSDKVTPPLLRWATFCAAVTDTRGLAVPELMTVARECEPKLEETVATNSYRFFFRPDLGYFSQKDRTKSKTISELRERQEAISISMKKPVYKLALERRSIGVLTANHVNLQKQSTQYHGYSNYLYGASMFLTIEELEEFSKTILRNNIVGYQFSEEPSMVLSYTYLTLGMKRTEELLHFFIKYSESNSNYLYSTVSFDTMTHPQGEIGYDDFVSIIDSLAGDDETPIEWAVELGV